MAMIKHPYELSVWKERLNGTNSKIEEKGVIIGAHDMTYLGKATSLVLTRKFNGTNTLTFQMPDKYFDPVKGDYVHNELIDVLYTESKVKLFYKNRWYEFFVKKTDEKKMFKSYMVSFTCNDAFIDELSRNGYGITFDTDLYNNVKEIGDFSEETLEDSIWQYHPENNWGDFTEYKEEKLYKVPVSQFSKLSGYKIDFNLVDEQFAAIESRYGTDEITNLFTGEQRPAELTDDIARDQFWDQKDGNNIINRLNKTYVEDIINDGYIYIPYTCISFCYGSQEAPDYSKPISYDRAATEVALTDNDNLILAPQSVDPRTIIQFYAFPKGAILEIDEAGLILNTEYSYFVTLSEWNRMIESNNWYIFEDTRLVEGEVLGAVDQDKPTISHTFRYIKTNATDSQEGFGNKYVTYEGYLSDLNDMSIIKGKKFSITDRTEINISDEIDQYATVYNTKAADFKNEYSNSDWIFNETTDSNYRVCSKIDIRQIIPQMARNFVQNGKDMDSTDAWAPMQYLLESSVVSTPTMTVKGIIHSEDDDSIATSALLFKPSVAKVATRYTITRKLKSDGSAYNYRDLQFQATSGKKYYWYNNSSGQYEGIRQKDSEAANGSGVKDFYDMLQDLQSDFTKPVYLIGDDYYRRVVVNEVVEYKYLFNRKDWVGVGLNRIFVFDDPVYQYELPDNNGNIEYYIEKGNWTDNPSTTLYTITKGAERVLIKDTTASGYEMINFGIIGQQQTIKKDKIYCLGIAGVQAVKLGNKTDIEIKIGKGALISEGQYSLVDNNILVFDQLKLTEVTGVNFDEENNILIDEPDAKFILFKSNIDIENPYFVIKSMNDVLLFKIYLFEAYTKGRDCFSLDNPEYRYSGRDLLWKFDNIQQEDNYEYSGIYTESEIKNKIIFEDDIMLGTTYGYQKYYIQRLKTTEKNEQGELIDSKYYDTMGKESYLETDPKKFIENELPLDAAQYTSDDYEIQTNYIDLNKCQYYDPNADIEAFDCHCNGEHICYYQKFGYCPYRFETEKHPRRVRTLSVSKSNRFNIIQSLSKVFEVYPQFYIEHKKNGTVVQDENNYVKKLFFITEKGKENKIGFRYEKNLKDISRTINSEQIVTKLYVLDVDSELSRTGLCSIKMAEDNPSADSYIIDFSYYMTKGMLDQDEIEQDLYGVIPTDEDSEIPAGFLYQLGYYNKQYDKISNNIINLQDSSYTELEANLTVNLQGIVTAQEQVLKIKGQLDKYREIYKQKVSDDSYKEQQLYKNYLTKLAEQQSILVQLIYSTFFTGNEYDEDAFTNDENIFYREDEIPTTSSLAFKFFNRIKDFDAAQKLWVDQHTYTKGILGQFNKEYSQIQQWKLERASYLKLINQISNAFYIKYEPYLKEGTWSDSNYLTDNAYYFGALDVAAEGAIPKVSYNISVVDISGLSEENEEIYDFDLCDTTYVEDIGMFGINPKTGLPNRLKTLISEVQEHPDDESKNSLKVQNFTTQFEDLFQQVTASVQSLTFNENIYKRSSNFTSLQNISNDSLQGALDTNSLTLLDTDENNIRVNNLGTSGSDINNHANKYKLDGQGLYFSNDGGQHWSVGVGPSGINADYIKVGTLDASKIRIADNNYIYFAWDKDGIVAYRDPQNINTTSTNINDSAIFNRYGLSIVNDGKIKLRAGYAFNGLVDSTNDPEHSGKIDTETDLGNEIGFYLYNSAGQTIFRTAAKTADSDEQDAAKETAAIYLVGEMLVTNKAEISTTGTSTYSELITDIDVIRYYESNAEDFIGEDDDIGTIIIDQQNNRVEITNLRSNIEEAIAYSIEKCTKLSQPINITEVFLSDTSETFTNISYSSSTTEIYLSPSQNRYVEAIKKEFTYTDPNNQQHNSMFYSIDTENNYCIISMKDYTLDTSNKNFTRLTIDTTARVSGSIPDIISYPNIIYTNAVKNIDTRNHYKYYTAQSINAYRINNKDYLVKENGEGQQIEGDTKVALYLNNKIDFNNSTAPQSGKNSRLFVCCSSDTNNTVRNIFSILKDGSLHIGGIINGENDPSALNDQIQIINDGIRIDAQGRLMMNFSNICDTTGNSLIVYIARAIAAEREALNSLIRGIVNTATSGLASNYHYHQLIPDRTSIIYPQLLYHRRYNSTTHTMDINTTGITPASAYIAVYDVIAAQGEHPTPIGYFKLDDDILKQLKLNGETTYPY